MLDTQEKDRITLLLVYIFDTAFAVLLVLLAFLYFVILVERRDCCLRPLAVVVDTIEELKRAKATCLLSEQKCRQPVLTTI
jgi:hypothetical protein